MELQHEDEQKVETTLGGLKKAFAKWSRDMRADREAFISDEDMDSLSPEEDGDISAKYFLGLLRGDPADKPPCQ